MVEELGCLLEAVRAEEGRTGRSLVREGKRRCGISFDSSSEG